MFALFLFIIIDLFTYTDQNPSKNSFYGATLKFLKLALDLEQEQIAVKQLRM